MLDETFAATLLQRAELIQVCNLDNSVYHEQADHLLTDEMMAHIIDAERKLRDNHLSRLKVWCQPCAACDSARMGYGMWGNLPNRPTTSEGKAGP